MQLVQLFEHLFDMLDNNPGFKAFLMDGQVIPVVDYLDMKPENRDKIVKYVKEGRLQIGPWYTLPDQFPVDGECLARNLLWGIRKSGKLGGAMRIGYTSFGWGQSAQIPQILANFDIDVCITAKRVTKKRAPDSEFIWRSPDGTELLTTRLGEHARANFNFEVTLPIAFGHIYTGDDWQYKWESGGLPFHRADKGGYGNDYFRLDQPEQYFPKYLKDCIEKVWKTTDDTVMKSDRLLMDGSDFTEPQKLVPKMIEDANKLFEDRRLIHDSLPEFIDIMKRNIDKGQLVVVEGELREGPATLCSANALTNRMDIKKLNRRAQNELIRTAEPMAVMAWMTGSVYPREFLDKAWEYLLLSHAHDSINGVAQEKIAQDVIHRLSQVIEISDAVTDYAIGEILKKIDLGDLDKKDSAVALFNPYPYQTKEVLQLWVDTQKEDCINSFELVDSNGNKVDMQYVGRNEEAVPLSEGNSRPWPVYVDRHEIYIDTGLIPACGFKVLKIVPRTTFNRLGIYWPDTKICSGKELYVDPNTIENEFIRVEMQGNGTFDLYDKTSGRSFKSMGYYVDTAEAGDMWNHFEPSHNRTYTSIGTNARIWMEECGELSATMVYEFEMRLPARLEKETNLGKKYGNRSDEARDMLIRTYITLHKGERGVRLRTLVDNNVEDHILKIAFPSCIQAEYSDAAGHFYVDRRPVKPVRENENGYYPDMQTLPMQTFVDISDGKFGMAVVSKDLAEFEAMDDDKRTVLMTLFKATRTVVCTEFRSAAKYKDDKGCQVQGRLELEYGIYLHEGDYEKGNIYDMAQKFNTPVRAVQTGKHEGSMVSCCSLVSLEGGFIPAAIKQSEDGEYIVFRIFNPFGHETDGKIKLRVPFKEVSLVTMEEVEIEKLKPNNDFEIPIQAGKWEIVTIKIKLK
jgi:Alpha-mannosidase